MRTRVFASRRARLTSVGLLWAALLVAAVGVAAGDPDQSPERSVFPPTANLNVASGVDPLFSRVVSKISRREATVHCWSQADWAKQAAEWAVRWPQLGELGPWRAYSYGNSAQVHLSPANCALLHSFLTREVSASRTQWPYALAWSIQTLTHEAVHVQGIRSEVKADCYGMQLIDEATVALGRTRADGRFLASAYWTVWYPSHGPDIRSPECRNGGRLDLGASSTWP